MKYLLDTNACIDHLRSSESRITSELGARSPADIVICSIVKAELIFGALRSATVSKNLDVLNTFFAGIISLPFDDSVAIVYAEIREALYRAGTPIGPNDLMIAAIALKNGLTLVTHNAREFSRVSRLAIEDWQARA